MLYKATQTIFAPWELGKKTTSHLTCFVAEVFRLRHDRKLILHTEYISTDFRPKTHTIKWIGKRRTQKRRRRTCMNLKWQLKVGVLGNGA
jgi:hypothetical protein